MSAPTDGPGSYGPPGPPGQPSPPPAYPAAPQPAYPAQPPVYTPQPSWSMGSQPVPGGPVPPLAPARAAATSRRALVVVAVLLGVAIVFAGAYVIGRLTAPRAVQSGIVATPRSAPAKASPSASWSGTTTRVGFSLTGSVLSGPGFSATMPSGWTLAADNGDSTNDGVIQNGADNSLAFFATDPAPAATRCSNSVAGFRSKLGGTVVDLPTVAWANGTAVVKELNTRYASGQAIGIDVYCVDRSDRTSAALLSVASPEHQSTNKAAAEALLASWRWR